MSALDLININNNFLVIKFKNKNKTAIEYVLLDWKENKKYD